MCCCCVACSYCVIKYISRPKDGCVQLKDKDGGLHKFSFHVNKTVSRTRSLEDMESDGQAASAGSVEESAPAEELDVEHVKIHVKWDVDIEKYKASNLEFNKKKMSLNLLSGLRRDLSIDEVDLGTGTSHDFPLEDGAVLAEHPETASTNILPHCSLQEHESQVREAYELKEYVEYYSTTHGLWVRGWINSHGHMPNEACTMPSYTVALRSQQRDYVELSHLRSPLQKASKVAIFDETIGVWLPALVECYETYPSPLAYSVKIEGDSDCNGQSSIDQGQQALLVPAHNVRPHFVNGSEVYVYLGIALGWVTATVCSDSIQTWPQVAVDLQASKGEVIGKMPDAGSQFLKVEHYQVRLKSCSYLAL